MKPQMRMDLRVTATLVCAECLLLGREIEAAVGFSCALLLFGCWCSAWCMLNTFLGCPKALPAWGWRPPWLDCMVVHPSRQLWIKAWCRLLTKKLGVQTLVTLHLCAFNKSTYWCLRTATYSVQISRCWAKLECWFVQFPRHAGKKMH